MTNEEAIKMIQDDKRLHHDYLSGEYRKALNMAIKALEQQKIGKWICLRDQYGDIVEAVCSECDANGNDKWSFCPNCGADMGVKHETSN